MRLGNNDNFKPKEIPPAGVHLAYCYRVVDCGWMVYEWNGAPAVKDNGDRKCRLEGRLDFELWPQDDKGEWITMADGKPFSVAPGFNGWVTSKRVASLLSAWRGSEDPEVETYIGQLAFVTVNHHPWTAGQRSGVNVEVTAITPVPPMILKTAKIPEMANPACIYSARQHDQEVFNTLPQWYRDYIEKNSVSFARATNRPRPGGEQASHHDDPGPSEPAGEDLTGRYNPDIPF